MSQLDDGLWEAGDKFKVIDGSCHHFSIGQIVTFTGRKVRGLFEFKNSEGSLTQHLNAEQVVPYFEAPAVEEYGKSLSISEDELTTTFGPIDTSKEGTITFVPTTTKAKRFDQGKPELHWLDAWSPALMEVARTFMYGAKKYGPYNYKKGAAYSQSYNCARRHMMKWFNGEEFDKEAYDVSGEKISHLAFAAWNILRLLDESIAPGPGTVDDRPKQDEKGEQ
jgi:hypothetical protein